MHAHDDGPACLQQARLEELPQDWPTVTRLCLEGYTFKNQHVRSGRALRASQVRSKLTQIMRIAGISNHSCAVHAYCAVYASSEFVQLHEAFLAA